MSDFLVGLHEPTPIYDRLALEHGIDPCRDLLYRQNMQAIEEEIRAAFLLPRVRPLVLMPDGGPEITRRRYPRVGFGQTWRDDR